MIVEVIAVGTELLLGQIVNTNAAELGQKFAEDGFDVNYQITVGDNMGRLVESIITACRRSDAVVMTGGIGPTQDDMTRDALCAVLGVDVVRDDNHAGLIKDRLAARGAVADTALKMADYPAGTTPLPNTKGIALGIFAIYEGTPIFSVPGVPIEMRAMIDAQVRPRLRDQSGEPAVLSSRVLHCWGLGEARTAELLDELYTSTNPSIGFLVNASEVRVRITAKALSISEAAAMIATMEQDVRARLGEAVFAVDQETIDGLTSAALVSLGWSIETVEVATGGLVAARLANTPCFAGGSIVRSNGIDRFDQRSVEQRATELLDSGAAHGADVVVAVSEATGITTGDATAARFVGVAVRTPHAQVARSIALLGDDERVRQFAVPSALHVLRQALPT